MSISESNSDQYHINNLEDKLKGRTMYLEQIILIIEELEALKTDLLKSDKNYAAAQRARVKSIDLGKEFKSFRKNSIKHFKELRG